MGVRNGPTARSIGALVNGAGVHMDNRISQESKVSAQFRARLAHLKPKEKVRAIVLLLNTEAVAPQSARQSPEDRRHTVEKIRESSQRAVKDIDKVLQQLGWQRLGEPNALGAFPVETTRSGISELAASDDVKAIVEDQEFTLIR
jgi:hypothetical protein